MDNSFNKCLGFKTSVSYDKPIFFYHVPKSGGTTVAVLLSHLFNKSKRVQGPLFQNNSKGGETAFNNFIKIKSMDKNFLKNLDFVYGHLPFEVNKYISDKFFKLSIFRDPIQRCLSHYQWLITKKICSNEESITNLFKNEKIPKNPLVNQFSGKGYAEPNEKDAIDKAYTNIRNNIDFVFDSKNIYDLLNFIISSYNFPNLLFQNYQVNRFKIPIKDEDLLIIEKNNELDIHLYSQLNKNNIFCNIDCKNSNSRKQDLYLYSSYEVAVKGKETIILNQKEINQLESRMLENNFIINVV